MELNLVISDAKAPKQRIYYCLMKLKIVFSSISGALRMLYTRGSQPGVHVPLGVHLPIRSSTF